MMNKLFTLILAGACFTVFAQTDIDYPYNPDFENDGFVGIEDVLELLSVYGTPFTPEQLLLDGASLTEIIESLQSQIDSLASYTNEGFGAIALNDSLLTEYLVGVAAASEEGDSTLGAWVMQLSELVEQQQGQIDSLTLAQEAPSIDISTFGDTLSIGLDQIIVPNISYANVVPAYGEVIDIDGNSYRTIDFGGATWMADNLRVTSYNDGTAIEDNCSCGTSSNDYTCPPRFCAPTSFSNIQSFGLYYSGSVMSDISRNVCPSGWHVSDINDWYELTNFFSDEGLPTTVLSLNDNGWSVNGHASDLGKLMFEGTNESYLNLPNAGYFGPSGSNSGEGIRARFWVGEASHFTLEDDFPVINITNPPLYDMQYSNFVNAQMYNFNSIRCVKD